MSLLVFRGENVLSDLSKWLRLLVGVWKLEQCAPPKWGNRIMSAPIEICHSFREMNF